ncbi:sugar phosphate isomerase/epimerase family protein [Mesorhizobium sp. LHD-90]|uniref:sugar phosphate isomerase/epimerase family protein n=1 Tax=Mesorhizobium sp. LHD-90 TaxID=3071414 RepID=UPI0027E11A2A|nr:sugar phosphate isomerase/epimerase family protein [Mesorhizobium sp. LHD-90]MDQ6438184.1 sugar phosphate isomerase/epimerase family protein [Mesorhizobium sp. LHD-90]
MNILLHTMATPDLDPSAALDLARKLDFDGVDLITQQGYRCALDPAASIDDAKALRRASDEKGVPIRSLTPYLKHLNATDGQLRQTTIDAFKKAIEHATVLGASSVRVLAGSDVPDSEWSSSVAILVDALGSLGDFAASHGTYLNIENHDGTLADDAKRTDAIWRAINHAHVGIIYDPANLIRDGKEGFPENLEIQAGGTRVVHVKDYIFDVGFPSGRCARAIGDGVIPWKAMLSGLDALGFSGDLSIEYETRWVPEQLPEPSIGLKRSIEHLRSLLAALPAAGKSAAASRQDSRRS